MKKVFIYAAMLMLASCSEYNAPAEPIIESATQKADSIGKYERTDPHDSYVKFFSKYDWKIGQKRVMQKWCSYAKGVTAQNISRTEEGLDTALVYNITYMECFSLNIHDKRYDLGHATCKRSTYLQLSIGDVLNDADINDLGISTIYKH